jgi:hypothetical protein
MDQERVQVELNYIYTIFFHGMPPRIIQTIFFKVIRTVEPKKYFNTYWTYFQLFSVCRLCIACSAIESRPNECSRASSEPSFVLSWPRCCKTARCRGDRIWCCRGALVATSDETVPPSYAKRSDIASSDMTDMTQDL